jgi:hypothetical protein
MPYADAGIGYSHHGSGPEVITAGGAYIALFAMCANP